MDNKLKKYLDNGEYLPEFIQDFHDQKTLFKRLNEMVTKRSDYYTKDIDWMSAQVYTIDIFLWFLAAHGYTLQKSRKQVSFYDIEKELGEFEERTREEKGNFLKQIMEQYKDK